MELYRRGNTDSLFYFGIPHAGRPWMAAAAGCGRPAAAGRCHRCRPWEEAAFKVQTLCISSNSYCFAVLKMLGTAGKIHIFFLRLNSCDNFAACKHPFPLLPH